MRRLLLCSGLVGLLALPALTAPGPKKDADKPESPATPEQKTTSIENLKQIGLAFHNHHDTSGGMPANLKTKDGKPGLSWRVAILPYVEEGELWKQFKLDEPWDSENNKKLIEKMPKLYAPVRGKAQSGETFYQMFEGARTLLAPPGQALTLANISDGTSNTMMVAEGGKPVIWTKPDDLPFDGKTIPKLGGMFDGQFHAVMGDGAVRKFKKGIEAETLRRLIDRADGQPVDLRGTDPDTDKD